MDAVTILLFILVLLQWMMIYALINRLLIQNRLPKMAPGAALAPVAEALHKTSTDPVEHPQAPVLERFRVTP